MKRFGLLLILTIAFFVGCGDDTNAPPEFIATESWEATTSGTDGLGTGEWDLIMNADSSIVISGRREWMDSTLGVTVACPFTDGQASVMDSSLSFTVAGMATIPSYPSSSFTLEVAGTTGEIIPAFCLNGEVMTQLLQGFGAERLADELSGLEFNCGSRILREEIDEDRFDLDVELECECTDPEERKVENDEVRISGN